MEIFCWNQGETIGRQVTQRDGTKGASNLAVPKVRAGIVIMVAKYDNI